MQWRHHPHDRNVCTTTRSPGATVSTDRPTDSTMPAPSCPITSGNGSRVTPVNTLTSLWQTPAASRRTSTSSSASARSSMSSRICTPSSPNTTPRIRRPIFPLCRAARARLLPAQRAARALLCAKLRTRNGGGPSMATRTDAMTTAELDDIYERVKNWGRWGADDQRGALNLLTDAHRARAASLVRDGSTVSLAHDLPVRPSAETPFPAHHHMLASGDARDSSGVPGYEACGDYIGTQVHGLGITHIDA